MLFKNSTADFFGKSFETEEQVAVLSVCLSDVQRLFHRPSIFPSFRHFSRILSSVAPVFHFCLLPFYFEF
jgi:hypothetical protein